jgi:hypothetical protein
MPSRIDPQQVVTDAAAELAALCGDALRTLVVYGSAAGPEFDPSRSDVNLAAVVDPLDFAVLQRAAQWWGRWQRHRVAAPLLLSTVELDRSRDVFPLELLDLRERHRTLAGAEMLRDVAVDRECVRAECEREAKGKLLRLRALYVELAGSARELHALMLDSRKSFLHVMRGLLFLVGESWAASPAAVVRAFERRYGCALPVLASLGATPPPGPIEPRFAAYVAEVELLGTIADRAVTACP